MELELSKAERQANELLNEVKKENESNNLIESTKNIEIENQLSISEAKSVKQFENIVGEVIDKGINYAIKALPIGDGVKQVALDIKNVLKTNDFKKIIKTAIGSSIREGVEYLSMPFRVLQNVKNIQKVALSGGLTKALSAGVDIVCNNYLKNNIFGDMAKGFVNTVKSFIDSKEFITKLSETMEKFEQKISKFKETCKSWYQAYDKFDIEEINLKSKEVAKVVKSVLGDFSCERENKLIQNITTMINNTKNKLSKVEMEVCKAI